MSVVFLYCYGECNYAECRRAEFVAPTNGLNKLECYIPLSWKGLPESNTLPYRAHVLVTNGIKLLAQLLTSRNNRVNFSLSNIAALA